MGERVCLDCGDDISKRGPMAQRCVTCAKARKRGQERARQRIKYATNEQFRAKQLEYQKSWREINRDKIKANNHARYQATSKEDRNARSRAHYQANREKVRAYHTAYRQANYTHLRQREIERRKANWDQQQQYSREYYLAHREQFLTDVREYRLNNPDKIRESNRVGKHRRRARERGQQGNVSPYITQVLLQRQNNRCAAPGCGKRIGKRVKGKIDHHLDHIIPIAKGGLNDDANLQVLCVACNQSKTDKDPLVFARERGMLL